MANKPQGIDDSKLVDFWEGTLKRVLTKIQNGEKLPPKPKGKRHGLRP